MPQSNPVRYADANPEIRAVYGDIMATRGVDDVKTSGCTSLTPANSQAHLGGRQRGHGAGSFGFISEGDGFGAVSASNGCEYCLRCHTDDAREQGMSDEMLGELLAVVVVANQSNIVDNGYQIPLDEDMMV